MYRSTETIQCNPTTCGACEHLWFGSFTEEYRCVRFAYELLESVPGSTLSWRSPTCMSKFQWTAPPEQDRDGTPHPQ